MAETGSEKNGGKAVNTGAAPASQSASSQPPLSHECFPTPPFQSQQVNLGLINLINFLQLPTQTYTQIYISSPGSVLLLPHHPHVAHPIGISKILLHHSPLFCFNSPSISLFLLSLKIIQVSATLKTNKRPLAPFTLCLLFVPLLISSKILERASMS